MFFNKKCNYFILSDIVQYSTSNVLYSPLIRVIKSHTYAKGLIVELTSPHVQNA